MFRLIPASVALATLGFFVAMPQASQAQPVGVQVQVGPVGFSYGPHYYVPAPVILPSPVAAPVVTAPVVTAPVVTAPTVVASPYVFTRPAYYPWFWDGHHWVRHNHYIHYHR